MVKETCLFRIKYNPTIIIIEFVNGNPVSEFIRIKEF